VLYWRGRGMAGVAMTWVVVVGFAEAVGAGACFGRLVSTDASQVKQYQALLETEGLKVEFRPEAIRRIAEIAFQVNEKTENIGARRLYTVLEKLLEEVSFDAGKRGPGAVTIDAAYVDARLSELAKNEDLARYV